MASKNHVKIDLHIHSNASDGTLSPIEILHLAQQLKLGAIAITDHDTMDGVKAALCFGIPPALQFITGVEVSANPPSSYAGNGSFHILGYGIDPNNKEFNQTLSVLQQARENRNPRIIERLKALGFPISASELAENYGKGPLGRPHIAGLMVKKGFVSSIDEAFDRYIGTGKPAYVDKYRIQCGHAISMIKGAGGIAVLAHPVLLDIKEDADLEELLKTLISMGLNGMEVHYPEHSPAHTLRYAALARKFNLLITGGTDFHGAIKPEIQMGSGKGNLHVPYDLFEKLNAA